MVKQITLLYPYDTTEYERGRRTHFSNGYYRSYSYDNSKYWKELRESRDDYRDLNRILVDENSLNIGLLITKNTRYIIYPPYDFMFPKINDKVYSNRYKTCKYDQMLYRLDTFPLIEGFPLENYFVDTQKLREEYDKFTFWSNKTKINNRFQFLGDDDIGQVSQIL